MKLDAVVQKILKECCADRALLLAVSGIDGSGKTTFSKIITKELEANGIRTALINVDAWHNPPEVRFNNQNPGEHFYRNAFRLEELFKDLILPLKKNRAIRLTTRLTRLPENDFFFHTYDFNNIDLIVLEGIFLLKRKQMEHYDFALWIDCSFEKALERAIERNQEGLAVAEIRRDYETIYFPAQRFHFVKDEPQKSATWVIANAA